MRALNRLSMAPGTATGTIRAWPARIPKPSAPLAGGPHVGQAERHFLVICAAPGYARGPAVLAGLPSTRPLPPPPV